MDSNRKDIFKFKENAVELFFEIGILNQFSYITGCSRHTEILRPYCSTKVDMQWAEGDLLICWREYWTEKITTHIYSEKVMNVLLSSKFVLHWNQSIFVLFAKTSNCFSTWQNKTACIDLPTFGILGKARTVLTNSFSAFPLITFNLWFKWSQFILWSF